MRISGWILIVSLLVVAVIFPLIFPLANPPRESILLDEFTMLNSNTYERYYNLTLGKDDVIYIQVSGFGQPVDFRIMTGNRSETLLEESITSFNELWTVPLDGTYLFYIGAAIGDVKVRITVSLVR